MASWTLQCRNCSKNFVHSGIDDTSILNYYIPVKPDFPETGLEYECPHCGTKNTYHRTDLAYQA